eukprot:GEZU01015421.1.p1 GENE.GEZU01015421.1~~GEZU01015421.1.p1  ORF type:complete len:226 (+),score=36.19 GEZU01015421.1:277-954(+)
MDCCLLVVCLFASAKDFNLLNDKVSFAREERGAIRDPHKATVARAQSVVPRDGISLGGGGRRWCGRGRGRGRSRSRSSNDTNAIFNVTEIRLRPASDQFYGPPGNYEMQLLVAIQDHSNNGTTICFATNTTVVAFNVGHSTLYLIASAVPYLLLVSGGFIGMLITTFVFFRNKPKRKLRRSLKEEQHAGDGSATEEEEEDDEDDLTVYTDNPTTVATTTTATTVL